jgi:hypothetical protein
MMYEQGLENSGYYRKRKPNTMYMVWLIVIVAAVLAITMTGHHDHEMTQGVNKKEVMKWYGNEDAGFWVQRDLFVLRDCANADRIYQQLQEMAK